MVEVVAIGQIEEMELELPCSPSDIEPSVISGLGKPGYGITKGGARFATVCVPKGRVTRESVYSFGCCALRLATTFSSQRKLVPERGPTFRVVKGMNWYLWVSRNFESSL
jgi:hypothetical protein